MTALLARLLGRLPIGWLQLTHARGRFAAALAGVAFADVLVLVQLGIMNSLNASIVQSYDLFDADIVISATDANTLTEGSNVARQWMFQALRDPQVGAGTTLFLGNVSWTRGGEDTALTTFGLDPEQTRFLRRDLAGKMPLLRLPDTALLDRLTRGLSPEDAAAIRLHSPLEFEASGRTISVVDTFTGGVGFLADGYLIVSDQTFLRIFPARTAGAPNHVLLQVTRGADPEAVVGRLRELLPDDLLRIRTYSEAMRQDQAYQTTERPTGVIFGFGVIIGILVGLVIVYQVLSTDVADHLSEYATFKSMGYPQGFLLGIVFEEALILALFGFVPGMMVAAGLYEILQAVTGLPIELTLLRSVLVFAGTVLACAVSGAIATRRLATADPADLF